MEKHSFARVKQPKISDIIMQQLETMILEGTFKPGQKLPPERELAEQFDVSRPSLREAIQKLVARDVLTSKHGGGNYVSEQLGRSFTDPMQELLSSHDEFLYDQLEFRDALEGLSAYYAALRATEADKAILTQRYEALMAAHANEDRELEPKLDAEFHMTIAECAHNVMLLHTLRSLFITLEKSVTSYQAKVMIKNNARHEIMGHHKALYEAIMAGQPEEAKAAVHAHLVFVEDNLLEMRREESRVQRSLRRKENGEW